MLLIDQSVIKVLANANDTYYGGKDFDNHVIDYHVKKCKKTSTAFTSNFNAVGKLKFEAQRDNHTGMNRR